MRYRIDQIKLNLDEALVVNNAARAIKVDGRWCVFCDERVLAEKISKKYGKNKVRANDIDNIEIVRRSVDARGSETRFVYTLDFDSAKKLNVTEVGEGEQSVCDILQTESRTGTVHDDCENKRRPLVVGFGPCGIFCALLLARAGLKPIVIERGSAVDERVEKVREFWESKKLDAECNVQFGEGGAGTFSDGKLNTGIKDKRIRFVLESFVDAGAAADILIDARPHIGTDVLRTVVKNIREEIIALGGEVRFNTKLLGVDADKTGIKSVSVEETKGDKRSYVIETDALVLALGHSARDTVRMLYDSGMSMEPKSFSMGVRVQHSQETIDRATYGSDYGHPALPPAYYKLSHRTEDGRGVYSFCMCPGGEIVNAASQEGGVVTNGMSNAARDSGFANSGILVDVHPDDYMDADSGEGSLSGINYQEKYERLAFVNGGSDYTLPEIRWGEYREAMVERDDRKDVGSDELATSRFIRSLPAFVANDIYEAMPAFGRKINGFDDDETLMVAIESRSSSPVRMIRDKESLQAKMRTGDMGIIEGLYPGGEGAGYAGGITSAACDGIRIAEKVIAAMKKK